MNLSKLSRILGVLFIILICMILVAGAYVVYRLPDTAERIYGPAAPTLSLTSKTIYSAQLLLAQKNLTIPLRPGAQAQPFTIQSGETVNSITYHLEQQGLIPDAVSFRLFLIYAGLDMGIQAGDYELSPGETPLQIAGHLQNSTPTEYQFVVLPGWRAEEIAAALAASGAQFSTDDFMALVHDPAQVELPTGLEGLKSLEGFLMPGQYRIQRASSAKAVIETMLQHFAAALTSDLLAAFKRHGLTLEQAVTLASMIQREAVVSTDQPLIASVFYNRLAQGGKLESDPTAQYALGYQTEKKTWWKNPLSLDDLKVDSPYNTYINAGLPPAPIANPGIGALQAVAYPAETGYYYFRSACDGSGRHNFARTYQEHVQNACP